jgi:hypothetical protein
MLLTPTSAPLAQTRMGFVMVPPTAAINPAVARLGNSLADGGSRRRWRWLSRRAKETLVVLAQQFDFHPNLITQWRSGGHDRR